MCQAPGRCWEYKMTQILYSSEADREGSSYIWKDERDYIMALSNANMFRLYSLSKRAFLMQF